MLNIDQRLQRLDVRLEDLGFWCDRATVDLNQWAAGGAPVGIGDPWPSQDGVVCFTHAALLVPEEWPLEHTRLDLDLGGEGLVHLLYEGGEESFGLDPYHQRYPLRDRSFCIEAEVVARFPFGVPNRSPRLLRARLVLLEPDLLRLMRQLWLVGETVRVLEQTEIADPLLQAAELALSALHWPSASLPYLSRTAQSDLMQRIWSMPPHLDPHPPGLDEDQRTSVARAADRLQEDLAALCERFPQRGQLLLTGQAHLDLAWLWPLDETRRKARRTYHSMMGLLDRYPEFRYHQTSAQVYEFIRQDDPALFARIVDKVRGGQWEPIGGMWVEPDLNMPAGESLVRQLLYGQRFFRKHFGSTHSVAWLPDCFGFSPGLPQILRGAGISNFFTIKLTWSETNRFPYDLFWWEGLDGCRVLAHMFDNPETDRPGLSGYNGDPSPFAIFNTWRNYRGKEAFGESLLSIGYGDGGGGVAEEMLEQIRELQDFPALPALQFGKVADFYRRLRASVDADQLPVWVGELYLELHRGTLTSQGRIKYLHRRAERDLAAAEVMGSLAALLDGELPESMEPQWQLLLRNQFHDILPGSSIREVYVQAEADLSSALAAAQDRIDSSLRRLVDGLVPDGDRDALLVVNPDLSLRPLRLDLPDQLPGAQPVEGGSVLSGMQQVPGLSGCVVLDPQPMGDLTVSDRHLENRFLSVTLSEDGTLASVYDKEAEREALDGRGNQLWAYVDKPRQWDAWDVDSGYTQAGEEFPPPHSMEVIEEGPHRVAVRVVRCFRDSQIVQDIRLWANSARLEFRTTLDWHDRHWLLKARFPLAIRSLGATFETAFGVVERTTHCNTSWDAARFEVAGHRFADLSEPGYGVALLNDGKYGHHAHGNELGLSLLRSPTYPDPLADEGIQTFTYALYPHRGSWLEGGVLMEAEDLNRPLLVRPCRSAREIVWEPVRIEGLPLGLGTLKVLEDGEGLVLRVYEPQGARGTVQVKCALPWKPERELDLLEQVIGEPSMSFTPFQIHSWELRTGEG